MMPSSSFASRAFRRVRRVAARASLAARPHALALMYHRIAAPPADPWRLSVSPERFAEQMRALRAFGPCLTFGDMARRLQAPNPPRRMLSVTFDDGYRDNLVAAAPILAAAGVPATVFVISGAVGAGRMFWWDALARVFLEPGVLPESLTLDIAGHTRIWSLGEAAVYTARQAAGAADWRGGWEPPRDRRQEVFYDVWRAAGDLPTDAAEALCDAVMAWAGVDRAERPDAHPMTLEELRRLDAMGHIEIGGHTVTHPRLATLPPAQQLAEMRDSRIQLGEMLGHEVRTLAYPFGSEGPQTARLAGQAGYEAACITRESWALPSSDPLRIPRLTIGDWDADTFVRRLKMFTAAWSSQPQV